MSGLGLREAAPHPDVETVIAGTDIHEVSGTIPQALGDTCSRSGRIGMKGSPPQAQGAPALAARPDADHGGTIPAGAESTAFAVARSCRTDVRACCRYSLSGYPFRSGSAAREQCVTEMGSRWLSRKASGWSWQPTPG
ncbi:hypothetical protein GCM10009646_89330 [Streptomyces aureus]